MSEQLVSTAESPLERWSTKKEKNDGWILVR
jgi:hypothetical protein